MKKFMFGLILICSMSLHAQDSFTGKALAFAGGYLSGHIAHETGHQVASWIWNVPIYWKLSSPLVTWNTTITDDNYIWSDTKGQYIYYKVNPYKLRERGIVAMGGFGAEVISSEVILASSSLKHGDGEINYYLLGWLTMTVLNPIIYTVWTNNNNRSMDDFKGLAAAGNNERLVKGFMLTHAAITALRIFLKLNTNDNFQVYSTTKSLNVQITF